MTLVGFTKFGIAGIPHAIPTSESLLEVAFIEAAISPLVLTESFRQPINILSLIEVAITKVLTSDSML